VYFVITFAFRFLELLKQSAVSMVEFERPLVSGDGHTSEAA
jgi:hypothetical protein